ncbi:MAG: hypothetical protein Q8R37_00130 [Nanoarchaeota archaeon]|nr:hypothetical protein [Nanoarchaeota archaeon]
MDTLFALKDEKGELYLQIEITKNIWKFLDTLADTLFNENWMIDDHYRGKLKNNDFFSYKKDKIYLMIIITEKRANIIILGLPDSKKVKEFLCKNYSFELS